MLLIPAIDIKNGQCVRLRQGDMDKNVTVFDDDPVAVAERWIAAGADRIHVVDLDGAKAGYPVNDRVIGEIVAAAGDIPVQVGGGIREEVDIETYLERGVEFVILGTRAVSSRTSSPTSGWSSRADHRRPGRPRRQGGHRRLVETSNHAVADLAQQFEADGVIAIIHTDISRDGMMEGVNVEASALAGTDDPGHRLAG